MSLDYDDDPTKDFRQRYALPEHFVWDHDDLPALDQRGYVELVKSLLPTAPATVLDAGCGDGWVSAQLVEAGYDVTGVDYSDRAVQFARMLVSGARFVEGDLRQLSTLLPNTRFDAVVCIEVVEHLPPQYYPELLAELAGRVAPGGRLVVTVPSTRLPQSRWHYKHFDEDEAVQLVADTGLTVDRVDYQHRISWLRSQRLWRFMRNRHYDLRVVRRALGRHLLRPRHNHPSRARDAGRFVITAVKR